jgi:hypothetical protein
LTICGVIQGRHKCIDYEPHVINSSFQHR